MSPLAKSSSSQPGLTRRFELFVNGLEIVNAYDELNNAHEQRLRFEKQRTAKATGDVEALGGDEEYCFSMEHGLPPVVGWGMGVDRVCGLVSNQPNIKDVLAFPMMGPET